MDLREGTENRHIWDAPLAEYGAALIVQRRQLLVELQEYIDRITGSLSGKPVRLVIRYHSSLLRAGEDSGSPSGMQDGIRDAFLARLKRSVKQENIFRTTITGPHRDNYPVYDNGHDMRRFSSQGEVRMAVLFLKLALVAYLAERRSMRPVLLFDDILLEIDRMNMERVLGSIAGNQLFFTSTEIPDIPFFSSRPQTFFHRTGEGTDET